MPSYPIADDPCHEPVAIVHALSPAKYKGERDGVGKIARVGGSQPVVVGHARTIVEEQERRVSLNVRRISRRLVDYDRRIENRRRKVARSIPLGVGKRPYVRLLAADRSRPAVSSTPAIAPKAAPIRNPDTMTMDTAFPPMVGVVA
jgi:hypothetical protein